MAKHQLNLLIRADAGPTIGTGHVMRTIALGQAWKQLGGSVTFVCGALPQGLVKRIESENFRFCQTRDGQCNQADARRLAEIASLESPAWIILDGYRFDDAYQACLRDIPTSLMVIDDYGHARHETADLILNQNVDANSDSYAHLANSTVLAGPEYVLMRKEFTNPNTVPTEERRSANETRRVLVTFGGADPDNWTLTTLQALSDLNRKRLAVDCVTGACYQHLEELEKFKKSANLNLRIHRNIDRMAALMSQVDMAITAGGSTCYELARCGVPSIVISIADNQEPIAFALAEKEVMLSFDPTETGNGGERMGERLTRLIRRLMNDPVRRQEMSEKGRQLVDGQGAQRIAHNLFQASFPIRNVRLSDSEATWRWQNDPEVRSVSLVHQPVSFDNHRQNLGQKIKDPKTEFWIFEDSSGRPIGQVCFQVMNNRQAAIVEIIVDQTQRGKGIGSLLITHACQQFFSESDVNEIIAQIKPGNAASERAFRSAGFNAIAPVIIAGKIALQFLRTRQCRPTISVATHRKSA